MKAQDAIDDLLKKLTEYIRRYNAKTTLPLLSNWHSTCLTERRSKLSCSSIAPTILTDYLLIASGTNSLHVKALASILILRLWNLA